MATVSAPLNVQNITKAQQQAPISALGESTSYCQLILGFWRSFVWLEHVPYEQNVRLLGLMGAALVPLIIFKLRPQDAYSDNNFEFQATILIIVHAPFIIMVCFKGMLASLDMNYEFANTRFVERLGNYRVRTCGAYARKTNLGMEEETTAQDVLDLIKWRTVCHFYYDEESEPFIERETVINWIKESDVHNRKLERLLKLPYSWNETWKKITTGIFHSSSDAETGIGSVVSDDVVTKFMWRRVELQYQARDSIIAYTIGGLVATLPVAQNIYWHQKFELTFAWSDLFYMLLHLALSTYLIAEYAMHLNLGRLQYNMALFRLRLFETLTVPHLSTKYGLPYLNLKYPTNRLAWWRMREQERHWFEWLTRQARRSTEWSLLLVVALFLSGVSSYFTVDRVNASVTYNIFLIPVIIIATSLTLLNVMVTYRINEMDETQVMRLNSLQNSIRMEKARRDELHVKNKKQEHACDFYLKPVLYCSFCNYVEFLGCRRHKTLFSLATFDDVPSCYSMLYDRGTQQVEEISFIDRDAPDSEVMGARGTEFDEFRDIPDEDIRKPCWTTLKCERLSKFGIDYARPKGICLGCSHAALLQYWVLPARVIDVVQLRGDFEDEEMRDAKLEEEERAKMDEQERALYREAEEKVREEIANRMWQTELEGKELKRQEEYEAAAKAIKAKEQRALELLKERDLKAERKRLAAKERYELLRKNRDAVRREEKRLREAKKKKEDEINFLLEEEKRQEREAEAKKEREAARLEAERLAKLKAEEEERIRQETLAREAAQLAALEAKMQEEERIKEEAERERREAEEKKAAEIAAAETGESSFVEKPDSDDEEDGAEKKEDGASEKKEDGSEEKKAEDGSEAATATEDKTDAAAEEEEEEEEEEDEDAEAGEDEEEEEEDGAEEEEEDGAEEEEEDGAEEEEDGAEEDAEEEEDGAEEEEEDGAEEDAEEEEAEEEEEKGDAATDDDKAASEAGDAPDAAEEKADAPAAEAPAAEASAEPAPAEEAAPSGKLDGGAGPISARSAASSASSVVRRRRAEASQPVVKVAGSAGPPRSGGPSDAASRWSDQSEWVEDARSDRSDSSAEESHSDDDMDSDDFASDNDDDDEFSFRGARLRGGGKGDPPLQAPAPKHAEAACLHADCDCADELPEAPSEPIAHSHSHSHRAHPLGPRAPLAPALVSVPPLAPPDLSGHRVVPSIPYNMRLLKPTASFVGAVPVPAWDGRSVSSASAHSVSVTITGLGGRGGLAGGMDPEHDDSKRHDDIELESQRDDAGVSRSVTNRSDGSDLLAGYDNNEASARSHEDSHRMDSFRSEEPSAHDDRADENSARGDEESAQGESERGAESERGDESEHDAESAAGDSARGLERQDTGLSQASAAESDGGPNRTTSGLEDEEDKEMVPRERAEEEAAEAKAVEEAARAAEEEQASLSQASSKKGKGGVARALTSIFSRFKKKAPEAEVEMGDIEEEDTGKKKKKDKEAKSKTQKTDEDAESARSDNQSPPDSARESSQHSAGASSAGGQSDAESDDGRKKKRKKRRSRRNKDAEEEPEPLTEEEKEEIEHARRKAEQLLQMSADERAEFDAEEEMEEKKLLEEMEEDLAFKASENERKALEEQAQKEMAEAEERLKHAEQLDEEERKRLRDELDIKEEDILQKFQLLKAEKAANGPQQAQDEFKEQAIFRRKQMLTTKHLVLQCPECRSVIFPQETLLEGIYKMTSYFLYADTNEIVTAKGVFDAMPGYEQQVAELGTRLRDGERVSLHATSYSPHVISQVLTDFVAELGGLLSRHTMEELCECDRDAASFRRALSYHRTNPLFDRVVVPFFLMLKHVSLFQGLSDDGLAYEANSQQLTESRLVERFAPIIAKGVRVEIDKRKETLQLLIHNAVIIFQPIWPAIFPRPPQIEEMLEPCARALFAHIWYTESLYGKDSDEYRYLVTTSEIVDPSVNVASGSGSLSKETEHTVPRTPAELRALKKVLVTKDKQARWDERKKVLHEKDEEKRKHEAAKEKINASFNSGSRSASASQANSRSASREPSLIQPREQSEAESDGEEYEAGREEEEKRPDEPEPPHTEPTRTPVDRSAEQEEKRWDEHESDSDEDRAQWERSRSEVAEPQMEAHVNEYGVEEVDWAATDLYAHAHASSGQQYVQDDPMELQPADHDREPSVSETRQDEAKLRGGGKLRGGSQVSEDLEDEEAMALLMRRAQYLQGPFVTASPLTGGQYNERKFVDWYIYQVFSKDAKYRPISTGTGQSFHVPGFSCNTIAVETSLPAPVPKWTRFSADAQEKMALAAKKLQGTKKKEDIEKNEAKMEALKREDARVHTAQLERLTIKDFDIDSATSTQRLLRIPVNMAPEQLDRLAYWRMFNLLSISHMRRLERSMWNADLGVLDAWRTDIKAARSRGALFGSFIVNKWHVIFVIFLTVVTVLRAAAVLGTYNDPNGPGAGLSK